MMYSCPGKYIHKQNPIITLEHHVQDTYQYVLINVFILMRPQSDSQSSY